MPVYECMHLIWSTWIFIYSFVVLFVSATIFYVELCRKLYIDLHNWTCLCILPKCSNQFHNGRWLQKLGDYWVICKTLKWITTFLKHIKQRVCICDVKSMWVDITSGLTLGSVLGPVLFLCCVIHLTDGITSMIHKYANNVKLSRGKENISDCLELWNNTAWILWRNGQTTGNWISFFKKCKVLHIRGTMSFMDCTLLANGGRNKVDTPWVLRHLASSK